VGILLLVINPLIGAVVIVFGVPLSYAVFKYERIYRRRIRAVQDQQGEVATDVEESALGIRAIKAFGRADFVAGRYLDKSAELRRLQLRQIKTLSEIWSLIIAQPQIVLGLVVLGGGVAVAHGSLSLGTLVAVISLYQLLVWPIESMGWLLASAQEANSAAERVFEVLDAEPRIKDLPAAAAAAAATAVAPAVAATDRPDRPVEPAAETTPGAAEARLVFENVSFSFPASRGDEGRASASVRGRLALPAGPETPGTPILTGVDLALAPGETVAVVGPTGCGKTTLTSLVPRLYDVTGGRILLDGTDIRDLPLSELRAQVACAFEDPTLFSASVRENLLLGRPEADEAQIEEALAVAQAQFVYNLPWGLGTRVGEQGLSLSGGQRQRLALARAVLGRPPVLVLDDPLSALDIHTEGLVEEALREVLAQTTGLVVAHRASTVLLADRVAVLGPHPLGGFTVTALGTHHELLESDPVYRDLLSQSSELVEETSR
jgi:ATP-binding cassette subfamily B protein